MDIVFGVCRYIVVYYDIDRRNIKSTLVDFKINIRRERLKDLNLPTSNVGGNQDLASTTLELPQGT